MTEDEKVELMIEFFDWDQTTLSQYHALCILRKARQEPAPTWDEFMAHRRE